MGAFLAAAEAVRRMSTTHSGPAGAIVNISWAASRLGSTGEYVDYAATKGAIETMRRWPGPEVAREGIRVNAVGPSLIRTDIHTSGGPARWTVWPAVFRWDAAVRPNEAANTIASLCSPEAGCVTGALVDVSGGR